jgi:hypothetical protein
LQLQVADHPNSLRGPKPKHIDIDEYDEIAKRWGTEFREKVLEPSIRSSGGGIDYSGTPTGNNDFAHILNLAKTDPNWFGSVKTVEDTGIYTPEDIALRALREIVLRLLRVRELLRVELRKQPRNRAKTQRRKGKRF